MEAIYLFLYSGGFSYLHLNVNRIRSERCICITNSAHLHEALTAAHVFYEALQVSSVGVLSELAVQTGIFPSSGCYCLIPLQDPRTLKHLRL